MDKNLWSRLEQTNIVPRLESAGMLTGAGRYIDAEDKKVHKFGAIDPFVPWIYVNPNPDMYCQEYQALERGFGFIPRRCMDCWKIVVTPRTFHELMELYKLQQDMVEENPKCWCKCGVERRDFVPRHYGGYFYTNGKDLGLQRWQTVRDRVTSRLGTQIQVILKRGCTEFELKHGPSNKWQYTAQSSVMEKEFWANVHLTTGARKQPQFVRDHIIQNWMAFAWGRGDASVMEYNNGKPLFEPCLVYHREAQ